MKISVSENNKIFKPLTVNGFHALESLITRRTYSPGIFKNNVRNSQNFQEAHVIGLDFDGGLTVAEAKLLFQKYKHIIAPTRNHRISKGGVVSDRFRVILFLSSPITDARIYSTTVKGLFASFPQADKACKDAARMFYPSGFVYSSNPQGELIEPVVDILPKAMSESTIDLANLQYDKKPAGWSNCKWALANGQFESGEGNEAMMAVASTCKKLNMTKEQAYYTCKNALQLREARTGASYDKEGLWREVIEVVYGDTWQGTVYVCREQDTWLHEYCQKLGAHSCSTSSGAFQFRKIGEILHSSKKVEWLVDGLLTKGGLSLVAGKPKSGKSTIIRQLAKAVCRGEEFLDRRVTQGSVLYLALEEQEEMLLEQFGRLGVTDTDPIQIHVGGVLAANPYEQLEEYILEVSPAMVVIDTLSLFANFKDLNSYSEVNDVLAKYRKMARESGAHVVLIHHQNKSANGGPGSILGSSAIHGAVDCAVIFDRTGEQRYISTSQRGGKPFNFQALEFDTETESYKVSHNTGEF